MALSLFSPLRLTAPSLPPSPYGNPEYGRLEVEQYRYSLGLRYGPLYRALNLAPDQIAVFEGALTEARQSAVDIWTSAETLGVGAAVGNTPTATSLVRMTTASAAATQEKLKALLGEAGYQRYQQFESSGPARDTVKALAGAVYSSGMPLSAVQGETLAQVLTANTQTVRTRMAEYRAKTAPILPYYEARDLVRHVDGMAAMEDVYAGVLAILDGTDRD